MFLCCLFVLHEEAKEKCCSSVALRSPLWLEMMGLEVGRSPQSRGSRMRGERKKNGFTTRFGEATISACERQTGGEILFRPLAIPRIKNVRSFEV